MGSAVSRNNWSEAQRAQVQACLDKVLSSPIFARAERQRRFLRYLVNETLAGNSDRLKGYTIGVEVFDRESDFDPMVDAIVRVEAARLRAKLREYYDGEGRLDAVRLHLPKGSYAVHINLQPEPEPARAERTPPEPAAVADRAIGATARVQSVTDRPSVVVLPFVNMSPEPTQQYFADGITEDLTTELSRLSVSLSFPVTPHLPTKA